MEEIELEICTPAGGLNYCNGKIISDSPEAMTLFCRVSPFEYNAYGIYFGRTIIPQVISNGTRHFIELCSTGSYNLVQTPSEHCFSFQLLNPRLGWSQEMLLDIDIRFFNYDPHSNVLFTTVRTGVTILSYSVGECTSDCIYCGECPCGLECNGGDCTSAATVGTTAFGIRYMSTSSYIRVITYDCSLNNSVQLRSIQPIDLAAKDCHQLNYPEQWFFIDTAPLLTGTAYPVYIVNHAAKYYLVNQSGAVEADANGSYITYGLTTNSQDPNVVVFSSPTPGNWREFVFAANTFISITFSDIQSIAFWGNASSIGQPVVIEAPPAVVPLSEPICTPPLIPINNTSGFSVGIIILVIAIILLLILLIGIGIWSWRRRRVTCAKQTTTKGVVPAQKTAGEAQYCEIITKT